MVKLGYFKFFKEVYNFKLTIKENGYFVDIIQDDSNEPIEDFLEYTNFNMFKNLIYECYTKGALTKIFKEYVEYNVANVDFVKSYGLLTIVIESNLDTINRIHELIYTPQNDCIKVSAKVTSKIYNLSTNKYDYSIYYIEDFLVLDLHIETIISTLSLLGRPINITNYIYEFIEDIYYEDFKNCNYEDSITSLQSLNIGQIDNGIVILDNIKDKIISSYDEILSNTTTSILKDDIIQHNIKTNIEYITTMIF